MLHRPYVPVLRPRFLRCRVRDARYCIRVWGEDDSRPLVMLHGMRDTSATFQFLVDALAEQWQVFAPDWRGHGQTLSARGREWFHEYVADLGALLQRLFGTRPVDIVGHSLGGNVASVYAGLCGEGVRRVVVLDAFGTPQLGCQSSVDLIQTWIRDCRSPAVGVDGYASLEDLAARLLAANRRLSPDKALYLAAEQSRPLPSGKFAWRFDSRARRSVPTLRTEVEWIECWSRSAVPMLWIKASEPLPGSAAADAVLFAELERRIGPDRLIRMPDTGHNIQHDAPQALAALLERFLGVH